MKKNKIDNIYYLEKAPVPKAIIHMSTPVIIGFIANVIYNIANAYFIGMLDDTAMLASITLALPFTAILIGIGLIFGVGGCTYISRLLGEKNYKKAKIVYSVNFYISIITGIIVLAICFIFLNNILNILGARGEALSYTKHYILVFSIGSPIIIANFNLGETVRAEGTAKESMIGIIISVLVNLILDPIFIFYFKLDVLGAAIGTVIGQVCSIFYYIWFINFKSKYQSIKIKHFLPTLKILINISKIGISTFTMCMFVVVFGLLFNNYANFYGDNVIAAFGVSNRIVQLIEFIILGLNAGVIPLLAFNYASKDNNRLYKIIKFTLIYTIIIVFCISGLLYLFRQPILMMFSSHEDVIQIGVKIFEALLVSTIFSGFVQFIISIFQAFGKGIQSNVISITRILFIVPIIIVANSMFGIKGLIWSLTVLEICSFVISVTLLLFLYFKINKNYSN